MFGFPRDVILNPDHSDAHTGDQIRGFGFIHSGAIPSPFQFLSALGFVFDDVIFPNPDGFGRNAQGIKERRQVESFLMAYDSNMAPIVGQQVTLRTANAGIAGPRVELLIARAAQGECDLVVHGWVLGQTRGYVYRNGSFTSDKANRPPLSATVLRLLALVPGQELTFTAVPPGSGTRMGIDRDLDGVLNGDE